MSKQLITTRSASAPVRPFSQGLRAGDFIFVSGQGPFDPETGVMVGNTIEEQTRQVLENIQAILEAGGATMDDVVKATSYLRDPSFFDAYNKVYVTYFADPKPARSTIACQLVIEGMLVEIDVVAYVGKD